MLVSYWLKGAQNVIISMAGDGALLVTSEGASLLNQSRGHQKFSLELVTLWLLDLQVSLSNQKTQWKPSNGGVACGTATTFSDDLATAAFIKETYEKVEVEKR